MVYWCEHKNIRKLQKAREPTCGSSCYSFITYIHLSFPSIKLYSLLLKLPIVCALTICWLSLFQSSTTLFVSQFLPISFLNLHFSSLNPLHLALSWLLTVRIFPTSPLLKPFSELKYFYQISCYSIYTLLHECNFKSFILLLS